MESFSGVPPSDTPIHHRVRRDLLIFQAKRDLVDREMTVTMCSKILLDGADLS